MDIIGNERQCAGSRPYSVDRYGSDEYPIWYGKLSQAGANTPLLAAGKFISGSVISPYKNIHESAPFL